MSKAPVAKKVKLRHYNDTFIMFDFVSVDAKPMYLECGVMLTNDSIKSSCCIIKNSSIHLSVGKDREYFKRRKKTQPVKLFDFVKKNNIANAKTLKPSYLVAKSFAKVGAPPVYGEKLIKPAMLACTSKVLGKDVASSRSNISFSNDIATRRPNEMASFVESKIVEVLRKTKFSLQTDESTIHNQAILLVYVRFIHDDNDVREEMLFSKSLPEITHGENIFNHIIQYCNYKDIPLSNLICIASDGATAMTR